MAIYVLDIRSIYERQGPSLQHRVQDEAQALESFNLRNGCMPTRVLACQDTSHHFTFDSNTSHVLKHIRERNESK